MESAYFDPEHEGARQLLERFRHAFHIEGPTVDELIARSQAAIDDSREMIRQVDALLRGVRIGPARQSRGRDAPF